MRLETRPTVAEDVPRLIESLPTRIKALTVTKGDEILGIGGLTFMPDGTVAAFVMQQDGAALKYPIATHKAALRVLREAKADGHRRIVATTQAGNPRAERWLLRLGFRRLVESGTFIVWVWEAKQ